MRWSRQTETLGKGRSLCQAQWQNKSEIESTTAGIVEYGLGRRTQVFTVVSFKLHVKGKLL